jgi:hypothetical protein
MRPDDDDDRTGTVKVHPMRRQWAGIIEALEDDEAENRQEVNVRRW